MRALIIEDEAQLRDNVATHLRQQGYAVETSGDGKEGLHFGREIDFDVAIVDLGLPSMEGTEIIRQWRTQKRRFPILVLTAKGSWQDKVNGLEAGADDYLAKPFAIEELSARIRALIRRSQGWAQDIVCCGPITLNLKSHEVTLHEQPIALTAFEYKLLEYLMLNTGKVVSKTELNEHLYEEDADRDSNVLEVMLGRLRRKLDPHRTLNPIETLRGCGYRFQLPRA